MVTISIRPVLPRYLAPMTFYYVGGQNDPHHHLSQAGIAPRHNTLSLSTWIWHLAL